MSLDKSLGSTGSKQGSLARGLRRLAVALILPAALLVVIAPASPASASTFSSILSVTPAPAREDGTVTVTASQVLYADGEAVTSGHVIIEFSAAPFQFQFRSDCPYVEVHAPQYTCQIDLRGVRPGFYSAGLLYQPPGDGGLLGNTLAGTVDFLVAPPLVGTITTLTASTPLTAGGGTLTATMTHDTDILGPSGTVDFSDGTTTICAGVTAASTSFGDNSTQATCSLGTLTPGMHHFTATYSGDSHYAGSSGSLDDTIATPAAPLGVTTSSLPDATVGAGYAATLAATGGTSPYAWSLPTGSQLPEGLSLQPDGSLGGTPTTTGSTTFTVQVTDAATPAQTATQSLTLTVSPAALGVTTGSLPDATVGAGYAATLAATGGTSPYTWSLATGSHLPEGLSLQPEGSLGGTPTTTGSTTFTVQVTDAATPAQTATQSLTLTVSPAPPRADLKIAIAPAGRFIRGHDGSYHLTVTNTGSAATTGRITVSVTLPTGLSYVGAFGPGWTCNKATSRTRTCIRSSSLAPGSSSTLLVVGRITAPTGAVLTITASVAPTDGTPGDNRATARTQVTRSRATSR
jgi:hypothetical protein